MPLRRTGTARERNLCNGPGSAQHRFALRRVRGKGFYISNSISGGISGMSAGGIG
ncbi:MAG: hypothetical protein NTAFB05_31360 [Nitrobacter sp.]